MTDREEMMLNDIRGYFYNVLLNDVADNVGFTVDIDSNYAHTVPLKIKILNKDYKETGYYFHIYYDVLLSMENDSVVKCQLGFDVDEEDCGCLIDFSEDRLHKYEVLGEFCRHFVECEKFFKDFTKKYMED